MINSVNANQATARSDYRASAAKNSKAAPSLRTADTPQSDERAAFATQIMRVPGSNGRFMSSVVFKSENFSPGNPVMLVKGIDVDGTHFEAEVDIRTVNPRNASLIEMIALDGYFEATGRPSGVVRGASVHLILAETSSSNNAFSAFDFLSAFEEHMETQRFHRNWEGYMRLRPIFDTLLKHTALNRNPNLPW